MERTPAIIHNTPSTCEGMPIRREKDRQDVMVAIGIKGTVWPVGALRIVKLPPANADGAGAMYPPISDERRLVDQVLNGRKIA